MKHVIKFINTQQNARFSHI